MQKKIGLLSGLFLISMLFFVPFFTGNALADQCDNCHSAAVEKPEAISDQEKFQPVVMASISIPNHADSFKNFLASNLPEITKKQTPIALGQTAHLIKPYVPNDAEMKWLRLMNLKVWKSQNTHCPCPWKNAVLRGEFELHEANGSPVLTVDF